MKETEEHQKPPDRRRYLRDPIIVFKIMEDTKIQPLFGYAKNISRGGFFIASINPRKPGESFKIFFQIPGTESGTKPRTEINVRCQCEVVWARKYSKTDKLEPGYGVRFIDIPEDMAEAIDSWVSEQSN